MPDLDDIVASKSLWSGTITFGLVSIPVSLFPAVRSQRLSLRMVSPDGTPLQRRYFNPRENRELEWSDIVRGYEIEKDTFVVVSEDELEGLAPEKSRDIDLRRFVPVDDLDPMYFERAYYLAPTGGSTKPYRLLAATMEDTGRAGIATFVMRGKEYLVAILAENGILRAETLRFADEVRTPEDVGLPEPVKPKAADVKTFERQIAKLTRKDVPEEELEDESGRRLLELVARKRDAGEDVFEAEEEAEEESAEGVIDLLQALQRSLEQGAEPKSGKQRRKQAKSADLEEKTKKELYDRAQELDIPGRSAMTKPELIRAIRGAA